MIGILSRAKNSFENMIPMVNDQWVARSEIIVRGLEEDILRGIRQPGDRLDERQIALAFEVSRTPVREAIQRLAASGLIEMRGRSGAIVARLSAVEVLDGFTVVAELEALAAAQAARRRLSSHLRALRQAHETCTAAARSENVTDFYDANLEFHGLISEASQNRVLQEQLRSVTLKTSPYRRYITYQPGRMAESITEHEAIFEAIEGGDARAAARAMRGHVTVLGEHVVDFLHFFAAPKPDESAESGPIPVESTLRHGIGRMGD